MMRGPLIGEDIDDDDGDGGEGGEDGAGSGGRVDARVRLVVSRSADCALAAGGNRYRKGTMDRTTPGREWCRRRKIQRCSCYRNRLLEQSESEDNIQAFEQGR
jgi:hypothetical protein